MVSACPALTSEHKPAPPGTYAVKLQEPHAFIAFFKYWGFFLQCIFNNYLQLPVVPLVGWWEDPSVSVTWKAVLEGTRRGDPKQGPQLSVTGGLFVLECLARFPPPHMMDLSFT